MHQRQLERSAIQVVFLTENLPLFLVKEGRKLIHGLGFMKTSVVSRINVRDNIVSEIVAYEKSPVRDMIIKCFVERIFRLYVLYDEHRICHESE